MKLGLGHVYFIKPIGMDGPIKIGFSILPQRRLEELTVWSPWPLEICCSVPGVFADEQFLHSCFSESHSHREWFHSTARLRDLIEKLKAAKSLDEIRGQLVPTGSIKANAKRKFSPERRVYLSYMHRINWTRKKLRRLDEYGAWLEPDDISKIMSLWGGRRGVEARQPTPEQMARLNEYLADPAAHSVVPAWRRKEAA